MSLMTLRGKIHSDTDKLSRNDCLMAYRKSSYQAYIASDQWRNLRARAINRDEGKCCHCGTSSKLRVHHHTYPGTPKDGQWHLDCLENLTTLCKDCHEQEHKRINHERQREWMEQKARREKIVRVFDPLLNTCWIVVLCLIGAFLLIYGLEIILIMIVGPAVILLVGWLITTFSPSPKCENRSAQLGDDEIPF